MVLDQIEVINFLFSFSRPEVSQDFIFWFSLSKFSILFYFPSQLFFFTSFRISFYHYFSSSFQKPLTSASFFSSMLVIAKPSILFYRFQARGDVVRQHVPFVPSSSILRSLGPLQFPAPLFTTLVFSLLFATSMSTSFVILH